MRAYPATADSGVEWLGEVPEHWEVRRLEHVASYRTSNVDKKTEDDELPVRLCNYTDVYYGDRIRASVGDFMEATASPGEVERFGLRVGDVLITKDSEDWEDIAVPALVAETADDFVCGYHLGIIRSGPAMDECFLYRAMQSGAVNRQLQTSASGVTRYGLPNAAVGDALLPLPPLDEQRAIAAYLDRETERIDALVAKKRLLIERLEEYRTALITRTVTRGLPPEAARAAGLDPSPRLKPSGAEWLGDVPEHWEVGNIRRYAEMKSGHTPSRQHPEYWEDCDIPWFTLSDVWQLRDGRATYLGDTRELISDVGIANSAAELLPAGTVILSRTASIGFSGVMPTPMATSQDFWNWVCGPKLMPLYLLLTFRSMRNEFNRLMMGSTHRTIYEASAASFQIPVPPTPEQQAIIEFLEERLPSNDAARDAATLAIERLQEYRTALITAAVTGKIDVRE